VEPLAKEGGLFLNTCAGVSPELLVMPLLMGPVCLLSQGRFEELCSPLLLRYDVKITIFSLH